MNGFKVINEILANEKLKAATFARSIEITPTQIYDLQKGKIKGVSSDIADKIIKVYPHYNKSWIMTGLGSMLASENAEQRINLLNTPIPLETGEESSTEANIERMANSFEDLMNKYEDMAAQRDYWRNKAQDLEYKLAKLEAV